MFQKIIGHHRIKTQLQRDLETRQLHHAYLFSGPEHVGKMALCREMVSLVKTGKAFEEGSSLASQLEAGEGQGLIAFYDDGETLKVEQVRKISTFVSRRTAADQHSFCIIENIERMTHSAANSFLKNLEEPPDRLIYLLTSRAERKLLATILSRVSLFRFNTVPTADIRQCLEAAAHNPLLVDEVMKLSAGRIGLALSMLKNEEVLDRMRELYDFAALIFDKDLIDRFALVDHLTAKEVSRADLNQFLSFLALQLQKEGSHRFVPQLDRLQELKKLFTDTQVNKRLFLEEFMLSLTCG